MGLLFSIQGLVLLLAAVWGGVRGIHWWNQMQFDPHLTVAILGGVLLSVLSRGLFEVLRRKGLGSIDWFLEHFLLDVFGSLPWLALIGLALLSGLAEEALFRGVLLAEIGLVPSSILFGVLHTGDRRLWPVGVWSFLVGIGLGWLAQVTHNLALPIAAHACSNMTSFCMLKTMPRPDHSGHIGQACRRSPV